MVNKVMVIEDDPTMLSLLSTLLRYEGYEVAAIEYDTDLESLLTSIREELPAAILLDVHLRQVDGIDLLKAVRNDPDLQMIRVVMTSGMDVSQACYENGADAFVLKPFMPDELILKLERVLALSG